MMTLYQQMHILLTSFLCVILLNDDDGGSGGGGGGGDNNQLIMLKLRHEISNLTSMCVYFMYDFNNKYIPYVST